MTCPRYVHFAGHGRSGAVKGTRRGHGRSVAGRSPDEQDRKDAALGTLDCRLSRRTHFPGRPRPRAHGRQGVDEELRSDGSVHPRPTAGWRDPSCSGSCEPPQAEPHTARRPETACQSAPCRPPFNQARVAQGSGWPGSQRLREGTGGASAWRDRVSPYPHGRLISLRTWAILPAACPEQPTVRRRGSWSSTTIATWARW